MSYTLSAQAMADLEAAVTTVNGNPSVSNREAYWNTLYSNSKDPYAVLAEHVVGQDSFGGATAVLFLEYRAYKYHNISITDNDVTSISSNLINADYNARVQAGGNQLDESQIEAYHGQVFNNYNPNLDVNYWTAKAPMDVLGPSAWNTMLQGDFISNLSIFVQMNNAAALAEFTPNPSQSVRDLGVEAQKWCSDVANCQLFGQGPDITMYNSISDNPNFCGDNSEQFVIKIVNRR